MKLNLFESYIELIPENYADKMYLARFSLKAMNNNVDKNIHMTFVGTESQGYADPRKIVDSELEVIESVENNLISVEWIKELTISYDEI